MSLLVASVAVPRPVRHLFDYFVPPALAPRCLPGVRVLVPFGHRLQTGYLLDVRESDQDGSRTRALKPIEDVLDREPVLDGQVLELTRFAADYYVASLGEMIRSALPALKARLEKVVSITGAGRAVLQRGGGVILDASLPAIVSSPLARELLGVVSEFTSERGAAIRLPDLKRRVGPRFERRLLDRLRREGLVEVAEVATSPGPRPRLLEYAVLREAQASIPAVDQTAATGVSPVPVPRGRRLKRILEVLAAAGRRMPVRDLLHEAGATRPALRPLLTSGLVSLETGESPRRPLSLEVPADIGEVLTPTPDQTRAIEAIAGALATGGFATFLLHGVTGSGKTEVYLRAIETAVVSGRRALYLVPEIALTPLLARRMRSRFGDVLALLHSGLSEGERYDEWRRIRAGRVQVVLGARSAVFAPIPELGLIVVDEEHDASYKQEEHPRYNGRDLAIMRGKLARCAVVLGSATPSMETIHHARSGRYRILSLPGRIGSAGLPAVERVDMRREFQEVGRESILSRRLVAGLEERLRRGEQSLVLLNRRGFSTFVLCRSCGEQIQCRNCSIPMTLHLRHRRLNCHYCDDNRQVPAACPACGSEHLHFGGTGTERLDEVVRAALPGARIERLDRDTARGRGSVERILTRVERGDVDVLLGTQMIAKGHDFPKVTLVGVLAADALLALPDFRSGERAFQLLAQVAGRSGRGERAGEVIVQAYYVDHHAIRYACDHDYGGFAERELTYRRAMNYPPYSVLAVLLVKGRTLERARAEASDVARVLRGIGGRRIQVLGPAPAPLERLRGQYRVQILAKAPNRKDMQTALSETMQELQRRNLKVQNLVVDVDPMSTL
jgi:primosomal protein N' (replication factor Y) (superfamily II helicase)